MASFTSNDETKILLGMGNPLLDISAEVPASVLEKYEVQAGNAVLAEAKHLPVYQDLVENHQPVQYIAGGATLNSIRVAQWMVGEAGKSGYFGCVGKDEYGNTMESCAAADGVNVMFQKTEEEATGTCAVLVVESERSLIANLAAANKFTPAHLEGAETKAFYESAGVYYIAGFFLTVSVDSILTIGRHAAENSKPFCMNLSAPFLVQFFKEQMAACLPYCDFVFGNESEAATLGQEKGWGENLSEIALKLAAEPKASGTFPRTVVFTQGSEKTIVAQNGVVTEFPVEPLARELLVDTNGAGDAFVGGFLSQLMKGKPIAECVRAGHWGARVIIQRSGCTFPEECDFE
uniref:Adenosine kinase n=1 Tax=Phaeomonas parva TaxID=124430 RepID=A0A7S1XXL6_9STRA|mmetsp:Transcript_46754/g.145971  ORF Transcript_46754/g.145971 Transcript_46754/m.145971 type:complete len:348 (+) Transcript_46754:169-1212(+)